MSDRDQKLKTIIDQVDTLLDSLNASVAEMSALLKADAEAQEVDRKEK